MGGAVPVVLPLFLLLLLPTHLLLHLQDDARELTEIAKVLDVRKLQRMRQVNLYSLLPSWDVGISLEMGSNRPVSFPHPSSTKKKPFGPCSLFPELSMSPLLPCSQKQNFKSKATSWDVLASAEVKGATAFSQNPCLQREELASLASAKSCQHLVPAPQTQASDLQ